MPTVTATLRECHRLRKHLKAPSIDLYRIFIDSAVLNSLSLEQSGTFWHANGSELPW